MTISQVDGNGNTTTMDYKQAIKQYDGDGNLTGRWEYEYRNK